MTDLTCQVCEGKTRLQMTKGIGLILKANRDRMTLPVRQFSLPHFELVSVGERTSAWTCFVCGYSKEVTND